MRAMAKLPKQDELLDFSFDVPKTGWMHTPTEFKEGMYLSLIHI